MARHQAHYRRISALIFAVQVLLLLIIAAVKVTDHLIPLNDIAEPVIAISLLVLVILAIANYLFHQHYLRHIALRESVLHDGLIEAKTAVELYYARVQAMLHQMPSGVIIGDATTGEVVETNALARELLFIDQDGCIDIATLSAYEFFHTDGRTCTFWELPVSRAARDGEISNGEEIELISPQGERRVLLVNTGPIRDNDGQIIAVVCIFNDMTAEKAVDRTKDEFLAVLSHELLTPLTTILGWADFATLNRTPEFRDQAIDVILRNARRQHVLLDNMLDVSRLLHQKLSFLLEPTDLQTISMCSVAALAAHAEAQQISLVCDDGSTPLPVQADPSRLQQAIGNLIENAIKFTSPQGTVTVRNWRNADRAYLSVTDTGRGIPPEELATIFDPFHQVQRDEAQGGLGLGLALVKGIVELHGGRVEVYSAGLGQGSTFTISLPLLPDAETIIPARDESLVYH